MIEGVRFQSTGSISEYQAISYVTCCAESQFALSANFLFNSSKNSKIDSVAAKNFPGMTYPNSPLFPGLLAH